MIKTTMSEERLRKLVRKIVREEIHHSSTNNEEEPEQTNINSRKKTEDLSTSDNGPWAVIGPSKPDPAKNFQRLERPRALPGWSENDDFQPGPYRPKR